jgi:hypothetical protein
MSGCEKLPCFAYVWHERKSAIHSWRDRAVCGQSCMEPSHAKSGYHPITILRWLLSYWPECTRL